MTSTQARRVINESIDRLQTVRGNDRLTLAELDAAVIVATALGCAVMKLRDREAKRQRRQGL